MAVECIDCKELLKTIDNLTKEIIDLKYELAMTDKGLNKEQRDFYNEMLKLVPFLAAHGYFLKTEK